MLTDRHDHDRHATDARPRAGGRPPEAPVMHAQDFDAPWPGVLDEMAEFVLLTQLAFGAARAPWVRIRLSRTRVTPGELQPHVDRLRARLARRLPPSSRIRVQADALAAHRVEVAYGSAGP